MKKINLIVLLSLLVPTLCFGAEDSDHASHEVKTGIESLSPELRGLFSQEMKALEGGMKSIISDYVSGNWSGIQITAKKMKNSYILKQNLSKKQVKELHSALPHGFIEKDKQFHYLAGMLEHVAKNKKLELVNFYFAEMNESCLSCHSEFAGHRFPALLKDKEDEHAH